jgi:hypothetical protein
VHGGGGPAQFAVLTVFVPRGEARGGEGRELAWLGDCRLSLCFLFVRTERSYGSKVDN